MQLSNSFKTMWALIKEFSEKGFKGDFKKILAQGFANANKITSDSGKKIAKTFVDDYTNALGNKLEHKTVDQVQNGLNNVAAKVKGFASNLFDGIGFGGTSGGGSTTTSSDEGSDGISLMDNSDPSAGNAAIEEKISLMQRLGQTAETAKQSIAQSFGTMSSSIVDSMGLAGTALGDYLNQLMNTATQTLIENLKIGTSETTKAATTVMATQSVIAADQIATATKTLSATATVASNTTSAASDVATAATSVGAAGAQATGDAVVTAGKTAKSFGPAAAFVLPALIAAAVTVVAKAMKKAKPNKFAKGGIVSGTTLGMVGEYPGAKSNPEVIAPLDKLKNMLPQSTGQNINVGGDFRVDGQDLVLALGRANENGERL
jgi:hypothetical protein